ncbi:Na+(H+)/acetate symporter ActP [Cytobacillus eiseniae]|uniref:Na+(H+)/acetate symporter ActP n=1 Tax=Cytobacillus eiseniae TaxID=762947 RepID=A0ABS4RAP8_9BACI|nr:hypothetical protein [Cytobacillus eiseniae]MBP2239968.1 Na+(H+)/acetate symporter ActP [Cytobacillus eiseniae]
MLKKQIIIIGIISLIITILSPFYFVSYIEALPDSLNQKLAFGGPFPFAEQTFTLPDEENQYPLEVHFESPFEKETKYKITPFIFSYICLFLFFFALYTIIARFFTRKPVREPEE